MTLINILDNEFLDPGPVVLDRRRFIVYIQDEISFTVDVNDKCVSVEDKLNLEI